MDCRRTPLTGQLRRLARATLDEQGIPVRRLRWMGCHSNQLFRADTGTGERLVVRVCLPGGRRDASHPRASMAAFSASGRAARATASHNAQPISCGSVRDRRPAALLV